jgi:hypothetical protein
MASVTAVVEFEIPALDPTEDLIQKATNQLIGLLPPDITVKSVRIKSKNQSQHKIILGVFPPDEVLPFITMKESVRLYTCGNKTYSVKMHSHRYWTFKAGTKCVACGLEGTKFVLERHTANSAPHFNFYGEENGDLILMTKDHIQAKSLGGKDRLDNYETMCSICNNLKSNYNMSVLQVCALRKYYNEHATKPRKRLAQLIKAKREEIMTEQEETGVYYLPCSNPAESSSTTHPPEANQILDGGAFSNAMSA